MSDTDVKEKNEVRKPEVQKPAARSGPRKAAKKKLAKTAAPSLYGAHTDDGYPEAKPQAVIEGSEESSEPLEYKENEIRNALSKLSLGDEAIEAAVAAAIKAEFSVTAGDNASLSPLFASLSSMADVGAVLVAARKKKDISQKTVAEKLKTHPSNIAKIEKGQGNPTLETIQKYGDAIGVPFHICADT